MKQLILILFIFISCSKEQLPNDYEIITTSFVGNDLDFFNQLNNIRISKGLKPLKGEFNLTLGCKSHSLYMSENQSLNHNFFWQRYVNSKAKKFGEVVSFGFINADGQLSGYQSSVKHYELLMNKDYEYIGISTINSYQTINLANYK